MISDYRAYGWFSVYLACIGLGVHILNADKNEDFLASIYPMNGGTETLESRATKERQVIILLTTYICLMEAADLHVDARGLNWSIFETHRRCT